MAQEEVPVESIFWAPARLGINEEVYAAAQAEWPWACDYVRRVLHDDSSAADLLQASAAAVSRAVSRGHCALAPRTMALRAYLRRAYIRRVWRLQQSRRREVPLDNVDLVSENGIERHVLIEELSAFLDIGALQIYHYRVAGESWASIGEKLRISPCAAQTRYYQSLARAQGRVLRRCQPPPGTSL
jgi:hypothetical protein